MVSLAKSTTPHNQVDLIQHLAELNRAELNEQVSNSIVDLAFEILKSKLRKGLVLESPEKVQDYLIVKMASYKNEVFGVIFLDNCHRIIKIEEIFTGTIDGVSVYPRVVVKKCMDHNAAAIIFFHNHPSGVADESNADILITKKLKGALQLIDVRVLDHIIVGSGVCLSFAERGLL